MPARIIEPTSKLDSLRVLEEAGIEPASCRTVKRRPAGCAAEGLRQAPAAVCARPDADMVSEANRRDIEGAGLPLAPACGAWVSR